ncbi:hypothetical protein QYF36_012915 [Acer negundo]|nr:hypothetical protein QYF36_012915 [Acer negundo]
MVHHLRGARLLAEKTRNCTHFSVIKKTKTRRVLFHLKPFINLSFSFYKIERRIMVHALLKYKNGIFA